MTPSHPTQMDQPKSGEMSDSKADSKAFLSVGRSSSEDLPPALLRWEPIATAPTDDRAGAMLAVVNGRVRLVAWGKTSHVPMYGFCLADQGVEEFDLCEPTHWMPLPPAPGESAGAQPSNEKDVDAFAALLSVAQRWAALDAGDWHVVRHASEKAELLEDTRAAIALATKEIQP